MIKNNFEDVSKSPNNNDKSKVPTHFHIIISIMYFPKNTKEFESNESNEHLPILG